MHYRSFAAIALATALLSTGCGSNDRAPVAETSGTGPVPGTAKSHGAARTQQYIPFFDGHEPLTIRMVHSGPVTVAPNSGVLLSVGHDLARRSAEWMRRFAFKADREAGDFYFTDTEVRQWAPYLTKPLYHRLTNDVRAGDTDLRKVIARAKATHKPPVFGEPPWLSELSDSVWMNGFTHGTVLTPVRTTVFTSDESPEYSGKVFVRTWVRSSTGFLDPDGSKDYTEVTYGWVKIGDTWRIKDMWLLTSDAI